MLKTVTRTFVRVSDRWMPDPLVLAIFLTFICLAAAVIFTDFGLADSLDTWGVSFWNLLAFTMQMILILGLGHVVANTRPVHRLLVNIAGRISSATMAYGGLLSAQKRKFVTSSHLWQLSARSGHSIGRIFYV